ncbi:MAG: hypothetical protein EA397_05600 [Deltaproteobacteria bacterium]|nr:MAG: hypothetical protein EA397_05600 [Deltaproteobacteria bacterium]
MVRTPLALLPLAALLCLGCHAEGTEGQPGHSPYTPPTDDGHVTETSDAVDSQERGTVPEESEGTDGSSAGGSSGGDHTEEPPPRREGEKLIFLTSELYFPDFTTPFADTSTQSADLVCSMHAHLAGLDGRWVAWLSEPGHPVRDRLEDHAPWHLTDGETVVISSLAHLWIHGLDEIVDLDEFGEAIPEDSRFIWTGTDRYGQSTGSHCDRWSYSFEGAPPWGTYGTMVEAESASAWTNTQVADCTHYARLLCIEQ